MKCQYEKCGKEIITPLELFNGDWACPYCRTKLFDLNNNVQFQITYENNEEYVQSEIFYHKALKSEIKDDYVRYLELAKELCKKAANSFHPQAIVRLGYYYDYDYLEANRSEVDRCRMARIYYTSICFGNLESIVVEEGLNAPDIKEIKNHAAILYYYMISNMTDDVRDAFGNNKIKDDEEKLKQIYSSVLPEINVNDRKSKTGFIDNLYELFKSCFSDRRPPLFGAVKLTNEQARELFNYNDKELIRLVKSDLDIMVAKASGNKIGYDSSFINLNLETIIQEQIFGSKKHDVFLVFLNKEGKHKYLSNLKIKKIFKALKQNSFETIRHFIENINGKTFTFYDDDVYFHKCSLYELFETAKKEV